MNNIFVGIDPSLTHTAVTILIRTTVADATNTIYKVYNILPKSLRDEERLIFIENSLSDIFKDISTEITLVGIESYAFGIHVGHGFNLGELGGIIKVFLKKNNYPFIKVNPTTLKKYVTGTGKCEKNQMLLSIYKKWKVEFNNDDEADSYALARITEFYYNAKPITKIEKEIYKSLKKQNE